MDLSQFRTLIRVAELGSLSKAADRLHIAQPALSRHIRLLEDELRVRLFDRHGRGMVLTEAGQDVLRHAIRIMDEVELLRAVAVDHGAPLKGVVSIGLPPTASETLSEPLVSVFRVAHPDVTVRIISAYSGYLLDWLHRGEIDVAILYDPSSARTLRLRPLLEERLYLIGALDAGLSSDTAVEFSSLEGMRLLMPSGNHGLRLLLENYAEAHGIKLNVTVEADSYAILKGLTRSGHGVTVLPYAPIHREIIDRKLSAAPLVNPTPVRRLSIAYPTDRPMSRLARFAGQAIVHQVGELTFAGVWSGCVPIEPVAGVEAVEL